MDGFLHVIDETPGTRRRPARTLRIAAEWVTAREVIRRRIVAEIADAADGAGCLFQTPVPARADADRQLAMACEAFELNRIVMLLDDSQIEHLDQPLLRTGNNVVTFLRLMPLVGGWRVAGRAARHSGRRHGP